MLNWIKEQILLADVYELQKERNLRLEQCAKNIHEITGIRGHGGRFAVAVDDDGYVFYMCKWCNKVFYPSKRK